MPKGEVVGSLEVAVTGFPGSRGLYDLKSFISVAENSGKIKRSWKDNSLTCVRGLPSSFHYMKTIIKVLHLGVEFNLFAGVRKPRMKQRGRVKLSGSFDLPLATLSFSCYTRQLIRQRVDINVLPSQMM